MLYSQPIFSGPDLAHLSKHDGGVSVEEGNAGQTLTALEGLDDHGLAWLEDYLGHLVSLEDGGLVQLLAAGLLADLPVDLREGEERGGRVKGRIGQGTGFREG